MTNQIEDTQDINFVLNVISRQNWVDEEILLTYESCYRSVKALMIEFKEDTSELDRVRNEIMELYGQI
jgi:hypothetical protein